jgi:sn-glycerol 3-phosphate transport system substrate-binding protein
MKRLFFLAALVSSVGLLVLGATKAAGPTKVTFWSYLDPAVGGALTRTFAAEFNRSQNQYTVDVVDVGDFKTVQIKLLAALRAGQGLPSMTMVDNAFFTRLALGGVLEGLDATTDALPKATVADFQPVLWQYGEVKGTRYGLPWAGSALVNAYNADAFKQKGLAAPRSWEDYAKAAKALTTRTSKGAVFFVDAWIFASMVSSRGGDVLTDDNRPNFDTPESRAALQFMFDLVKDGSALVRTLNEANFAVIDWVRTKTFMVTVPTSVYPLVKGVVSFQVGATPMPGATLAGEAQLVVPKAASDAERDGALEFWQYLVRADNVARFAKATYYLPVRRSALPLMGDAAGDPVMKAGLEALSKANNPPHLIEYGAWRTILEAQLERSLKGGLDPKTALAEAQRQILLYRP